MLVVALLAVLSMPAVADGVDDRVHLRMVTKSRTFAVGQPVTVTVTITEAADVSHAPFYVTFDPTVLQFQSAEEGTFLNRDGKQTTFLAAPTRDGDSVAIGLSRMGKVAGISGKGELCVLHFTAINAGDAKLGFSKVTVKSSRNHEIGADLSRARVVVQ